MKVNPSISKYFLILAIISMILTGSLTSVAASKNTSYFEGFDKGPSYKSVIPLKKTIFVDFDEETFLDDYAYLAAVPTSVFNDEDKLFSHPLLFYQDEYRSDDEKELSINARKGIDYFMEDWVNYCNDALDEIITINVPEKKVSQWNAKKYTAIEGANPYDIAKEISLHDWSYSNDIVLAVIDEQTEKSEGIVSNKIEQTFPAYNVKKLSTIKIEQINCLSPEFGEFQVGDKYKHIKADAWWDAIFTINGAMISEADPNGNPDVQLYCKEGEKWIQTVASCNNLLGPLGHKYTQSYVYAPGTWKIGITDLPTEGIIQKLSGKNILATQGNPLKAFASKRPMYHVDISMYPGPDNILLPDVPSFGCRDACFKLTWKNPSVNLGFSMIGPSGEAIFTKIDEGSTTSQKINLDSIGECLPGESYSISVFSTNDVLTPTEFEIEYSWKESISKTDCESLTSAAEGAILASILNTPLLYTSSSSLSPSTEEVLYKLGVENVYIVNIGNHLSEDVIDDVRDIAEIKANYKSLKEIYDAIKQKTNQNDVVFTTVDPWTYWYLGELKPASEKEGALFVGPAAYIAAHHGSPVIIIDNHPRLSSSVIYHNELWRRFADRREYHRPSTAEMIITGRRIYDFLKDYGFDKEEKETIITVAGQYDIGMTWDRVFPGVANSGRFCGTPVDTSYWISRNMFYPALVFENPALNGKVELENGSISKRKTGIKIASLKGFLSTKEPLIGIDINSLKILRKTGTEEFEFPVLCSFVSYNHRFNERAGKYYEEKYIGADGLTPGFEKTDELIDQGSMKKITGNKNSIFPDMSESEIVPFYLEKGGYDCAFSTSMKSVVNNLNNGVVLWIHSSHGSEINGGSTLFWKPDDGFARRSNFAAAKIVRLQKSILDFQKTPLGQLITKLSYDIKEIFMSLEPAAGVFKETNPWRGYEWASGSTNEPDTMSADIKGTIPYTSIKFPLLPSSSMDRVVSNKPFKTILNKIIPLVDPFDVENMHDGVIGSIAHSKFQYDRYKATDIEENLENLHSAGFITTMCGTSNTYLHLMLIRHGSVFQIQNPWPTSMYGSVWQQSIPRDIILGKTAGEAYTRGLSHVGNLYLGDSSEGNDKSQLWWDNSQSIVYFGDPNLRIFVPNTEYSDNNYWEEKDVRSLPYEKDQDINGHMPFGVKSHPNEKTPKSIFEKYLSSIILTIAVILIIVSFVIYFLSKRRIKK